VINWRRGNIKRGKGKKRWKIRPRKGGLVRGGLPRKGGRGATSESHHAEKNGGGERKR